MLMDLTIYEWMDNSIYLKCFYISEVWKFIWSIGLFDR